MSAARFVPATPLRLAQKRDGVRGSVVTLPISPSL